MVPKLATISGKELVKLLSKLDIVPIRQSGSHIQLKGFYNGQARFTTIPIHGKDLPKGLLLQILRDCGISREEFERLV